MPLRFLFAAVANDQPTESVRIAAIRLVGLAPQRIDADRRQEGKEDVVLRTDIEELAASGQSLMPEGLEKDIKPQDMADLIALLGARPSPPSGAR